MGTELGGKSLDRETVKVQSNTGAEKCIRMWNALDPSKKILTLAAVHLIALVVLWLAGLSLVANPKIFAFIPKIEADYQVFLKYYGEVDANAYRAMFINNLVLGISAFALVISSNFKKLSPRSRTAEFDFGVLAGLLLLTFAFIYFVFFMKSLIRVPDVDCGKCFGNDFKAVISNYVIVFGLYVWLSFGYFMLRALRAYESHSEAD